ncbi:MAG: glycosyl transferase [Candidatus Lokiarchaeota archaeon]|nr:glycosyl transferase [Candidatus Lokiarchaeota archaeon]
MSYGYFDDDNKEYVITRPDTPLPWINYLSNGKYCAMVSNTGGGFSFYIDPRDQRILRYRYNNLPMDRPGRYFYIRDNQTSEYWTPTWQPVPKNLDNYECRHGLGYTRISSSYKGLDVEILYFVPLDDDLEIWSLTLHNNSSEKKELGIFSYAEFCLWNALSDQRDLQYIQNVAVANYDQMENTIFYHLFDFSSYIAFFSSNSKVMGFDCDRESFIGHYRSEANPISVENGKCRNSQALGGNPIAATCNELKMNPHETKKLIFVLGVVKEKSHAKRMISKYEKSEEVEIEFLKLKEKWNKFLEKFIVDTPEKDFNCNINIWNPYQCKTTFDWARYVSFYETGIGRGIGFRDSNQDTLAVCHTLPNLVRKRLLELAKNQFENGKVYHIYFPLTGEGDYPNYVNPRMKFFSDDHLWMIFAVSNYLKETGDMSILEQDVDYVEGSKEILYDHLKRAIEFTNNHMGSHGFPLIGTADWNDTLQLHGPNNNGESVMVAMQFHKALSDMSEIANELNNNTDAAKYDNLAKKVSDHINKHAWDGQWYIRAFTDDGEVIGSKSNKEGKIFLNTQSWAVFSKVAPIDRGFQCMNSVREHLVTDYGIKLLNPPYTRYYPELKGISTFPPGLKENGSIFCHSNPWAEIAECILGRGDIAFEYFTKIAPTTKNKIAEIHQTEPYIYSQMITGNDHPNFGAAKNSWLTGTASWTLKAATDWILGIRPQFHGLMIDPCIPKKWDEFRVTRHYRDGIYNIHVQNPNHLSKGKTRIRVDNIEQENNMIPIFKDSKKHSVEVKIE